MEHDTKMTHICCSHCDLQKDVHAPHSTRSCTTQTTPSEEWEKEFDSAFNWIESEKERCKIMYGFTSEKLKDFIRETRIAAYEKGVRDSLDMLPDNRMLLDPKIEECREAISTLLT